MAEDRAATPEADKLVQDRRQDEEEHQGLHGVREHVPENHPVVSILRAHELNTKEKNHSQQESNRSERAISNHTLRVVTEQFRGTDTNESSKRRRYQR